MWSTPDPGDPPPCFRQGDLIVVQWLRPEFMTFEGQHSRVSVEVRTETVALVSACCDLVVRSPPKRKGVLISPLRSIPKDIRRSPEALTSLKATAAEAREAGHQIPANLFYFASTTGPGGQQVDEGVVHLEAMSMLTWDALRAATKIAELDEGPREELRERIKFHFGR